MLAAEGIATHAEAAEELSRLCIEQREAEEYGAPAEFRAEIAEEISGILQIAKYHGWKLEEVLRCL